MLAHLANEDETGSHGVPMSVAMDPKNQFRFKVGLPVTDWAAHTLAEAQKQYYEANPDAQRAGHRWSVHLDDTTN